MNLYRISRGRVLIAWSREKWVRQGVLIVWVARKTTHGILQKGIRHHKCPGYWVTSCRTSASWLLPESSSRDLDYSVVRKVRNEFVFKTIQFGSHGWELLKYLRHWTPKHNLYQNTWREIITREGKSADQYLSPIKEACYLKCKSKCFCSEIKQLSG